MIATAKDLSEANEAVAALLDQLGLEAYLFEVEPHEGRSGVRVDCARAGIWQSVTMAVDIARLLHSRTDAVVRDQLLADWGKRLCEQRFSERASANS